MTVLRATGTCLATAALALLTGCGSTTPGTSGGGAATPSSSTPGAAPAPPDAVPPADGPVTGVGTVIEVPEKGPELCLGPVMESFPPQCEGLPLGGWDWAEAGASEDGASVGNPTRWGTYAVTGTFDGLTLQVTEAVPTSPGDLTPPPSPRPMAPPILSEEQWVAVESGVRALPGMLTSSRPGGDGPVYVEVVHDDGTLQEWADRAFGTGAVRVTSLLR